jgi:glycosyltransferase involved in cell wall biosynthesis
MILLDSLYINNSGGKVLLDYLVEELEKSDLDIYYLFDKRCEKDFQFISSQNKTYLRASLFNRHKFYKENSQKWSKIFCFGNLPPTFKLDVPVYTYFHQKLYLQIPKDFAIKQKIILKIKSKIFKKLVNNASYWMVQTSLVKNNFLDKYKNIESDKIILMPFYSHFTETLTISNREKNSFLYVSNGSAHKNHQRLLKAFVKFYQKQKTGKLYVTIGNEFLDLKKSIAAFQKEGVPIVNVGFLNRKELYSLYMKSEFLVFPSLTESFGLGLLEAMECGCKIIGADLPYIHTVCNKCIK